MQDLDDFLASYARAWRANDTAALARHWRPERFAFYKAEEVERFFLAWDEVLAYWRGNERAHARVELAFGAVDARIDATTAATGGARPTGDVRYVPVPMRWRIAFTADARLPDGAPAAHRGSTMAGENTVLCLFATDGDGPKLCGWSETPDAPLAYVRRLYRYAASSSDLAFD